MRKVLVVDDESDSREFVRAILEPMGWEVCEAEDGSSGLEMAKSARPDLIILDVQMPDMSGFDVFGKLIKNGDADNAKIIMLTGIAEKTGMGFSSEEMGDFLGREPDAYIEKPIDPETMKHIVNRVAPTQ